MKWQKLKCFCKNWNMYWYKLTVTHLLYRAKSLSTYSRYTAIPIDKSVMLRYCVCGEEKCMPHASSVFFFPFENKEKRDLNSWWGSLNSDPLLRHFVEIGNLVGFKGQFHSEYGLFVVPLHYIWRTQWDQVRIKQME